MVCKNSAAKRRATKRVTKPRRITFDLLQQALDNARKKFACVKELSARDRARLAKAAHMSRTTVHSFCKGSTPYLRFETIKKLAEARGYDVVIRKKVTRRKKSARGTQVTKRKKSTRTAHAA
jgi:hypothetical protein